MARLKTKENEASVSAFLDAIGDDRRRADCRTVIGIMENVTGEPAKMWGSSIIGFGSYHYKYASGHEGDSMLVGVSPRKQALTIYIMSGFSDYQDLLQDLGKFKTGKSCLYVNNLDDINLEILGSIIGSSVEYMRQKYGGIS